jgi:hypothetical protein
MAAWSERMQDSTSALDVLNQVTMRYTMGLREADRHLAKSIKALEEGHGAEAR